MQSQEIDIIVPVVNEGENIEELVERVDVALLKENIKYRIIFIDDYSADNTLSEINRISQKYPVISQLKKGKKGKAYSILQGASIATTEYIAMLDADLQYPPEALPQLYKIAKEQGIAVANRIKHKTSLFRRIASKINIILFERLLHGFTVDTQSGLKVFKKEIIEHINSNDVSGWALDMTLLHTGMQLGYTIGSFNIVFAKRKHGKSKIQFLQASKEIVLNSIKLKLKKSNIYPIKADHPNRPIGAGIAHKGKRFIMHTHLSHERTAFHTFYPWQKYTLLICLLILGIGVVVNTLFTAIVVIGILTWIYSIDFLFSLYVLLKSLHYSSQISISEAEILKLDNHKLPVYSILCPLYKEARILPHFIKAMDELDWPKEKLEVLLLLEEDDKETINVACGTKLPSHFRILVVPDSKPKTKPKACNFGFAHARGEYVVIYDAEDRPEPLQLKKSYIAFQKSSENIVCLQSKLNYYNTHQNWLTRLFTAEYSLWFDLVLPGLQSVETTIPLGGTSNHFRSKDLAKLNAWDPFNVTEDCDLGVRLFREGKKTAIIDSITYEEANSKFFGWFRQRSRWIKGYLQTYLVHMRSPLTFIKEHGLHAFLFQLVIGMRMLFILINPILWLLTISYFALYPYVGYYIEQVYPPVIFYPAATLLVFANFMYLYNYMIGCAIRKQWSVVKYVLLVPFYWLMTSFAAVIAFYQLFVKPHYWEKTKHGLHLGAETQVGGSVGRGRLLFSSARVGGAALVIASVAGNFSNFLYNAYLGRVVTLEEFGTVSLISSIFALSAVITGAVTNTVAYKSAKLLGKVSYPVKKFWASLFSNSIIVSLLLALVWIFTIPFLAQFFKSDSMPFLLFTPVWVFAFLTAVNRGFLSGNLKFFQFALLVVIEALTKLIMAFIFVETGNTEFVYASIPASIAIAFFLSWFIVNRIESRNDSEEDIKFPKKFFGTSILTSLSITAFLSVDVIAAKHYLLPSEAGTYALLSLVGKMIFFLSSLFSQFVTPLISFAEGANKDSKHTFYKLLGLTALASIVGYTVFALAGFITIPILFGSKALSIVSYLPLYGIAISGYSLASCIINYHQIKKHYLFPIVGFLFAMIQIVGIYAVSKSLNSFVTVVSVLAIAEFAFIVLLHIFYPILQIIGRNIGDFIQIFSRLNWRKQKGENLRILVFNWRDNKHVWAGGAEVYVHELAKRWVGEGHHVTLFCGNDGNHVRNEVVEGVQIVRRGGFYTVYFWAALYYLFRFRGHYDVIIDCENGIPFFTPFYSSIPKFLLIHHVHQEVFRNHLSFPYSFLAMFLESRLMPLLYRNTTIITISESSKNDIIKMGWINLKNIQVVHPGINISDFKLADKTPHPTFVYLGRLKLYKNVDTAIAAFARILGRNPKARLVIAGDGESKDYYRNFAAKLNLNGTVTFTGRVTQDYKAKLLSSAWVVLQPSAFEGWGITVLEANASGTPVIASKTTGLKESVVDGQTGLLVPIRDDEQMAANMERLIDQKDYRKRLSHSAYEWSKKFSWDNSSQKFIEIINNKIIS